MVRIDVNKSALLRVCQFPKHEGESWYDILEEDRRYIEWIVSLDGPGVPHLSPILYEFLIELLEEDAI